MSQDKYQKLPIFHFATEIKKRHGKKTLKCLIVGNFGASNLGDEAILAGEIAELKKISHLSITVAARTPQEIRRLHNVNAVSLYALRPEIKKADFIIIGGGGLINKIERNIIGFFYQLYMIFAFFMLPRFYRKKIYVLGIGIYSNANPFIVGILKPFLRQAAIISVRDYHSYEFLKSCGILSTLYKDNSYLMDITPLSEVMGDQVFKTNYRKERNNIGLSLIKPESAKEEKYLMQLMHEYVGRHLETSDFWFFPADVNPEYFNDRKFGEKLLRELKKHYGDKLTFHFVSERMLPQEFFSSFKLMNVFIAMRFHAALFSYRLKIPFVGISYDKKCSSLLDSIGKKPLSLKNLTLQELESNVL